MILPCLLVVGGVGGATQLQPRSSSACPPQQHSVVPSKPPRFVCYANLRFLPPPYPIARNPQLWQHLLCECALPGAPPQSSTLHPPPSILNPQSSILKQLFAFVSLYCSSLGIALLSQLLLLPHSTCISVPLIRLSRPLQLVLLLLPISAV